MRIEDVDKNFRADDTGSEQTVFCDVLQPPFTVYGLLHDDDGYHRIPHSVAKEINDSVQWLNLHTAGGRIRFCTDADRINLRVKMRAITKMPHFPLTGSAGFDLYADKAYCGTFVPPMDIEDGYSASLQLNGRSIREITVNFPLYSGVSKLEIGFSVGSELLQAKDYTVQLPVVFYGSSITQGGCASRPGNAYQSILSRLLSCDYLNLGFSGSAKGERCMAEYIASLRMSAFVLDYDHNAPTPAFLEATHAAFFRTIREKNPILPIIMLSRPQPNPTAEDLIRRDIVKRTWETAVQNGDQNVYFIDGTQMLRLFGGDCGTVDNCHPNDLGFYCMSKALEPVLRSVLNT